MEKSYDFYGMGMRYAKESLVNLKNMAQNIGKQYGRDAKMEFESGIAMTIPSYSNFMANPILKNEIENNATTDLGLKNTRNNSYFGTQGTGVQFLRENKYNDPKKR